MGRVLCGIPGVGLTSEGQEHWGGGPGAAGVHGDGAPLLHLFFWEESAGGPAITLCSERGLSGPQDDPPRLGVVLPSFTDKEMRPRVPDLTAWGGPTGGRPGRVDSRHTRWATNGWMRLLSVPLSPLLSLQGEGPDLSSLLTSAGLSPAPQGLICLNTGSGAFGGSRPSPEPSPWCIKWYCQGRLGCRVCEDQTS